MSKSLSLIIAEANQIEAMLIDVGGELTAEVEMMLRCNQNELEKKTDSYAFIIDRMNNIAEFYNDKALEFKRIADSAHSVAFKLKENMKFAMESGNLTEIIGEDFKFKIQNSPPSCVIESEKAIDGKYKVTETITKIDKKAILEDLRNGKSVAGASLKQGTNLRKYPNTKGVK